MSLQFARAGIGFICAGATLALAACTSSSGGSAKKSTGSDACDPGDLGSGFELTVTPGQGTITVQWAAVDGADRYDIAFSNSSGECTSPAGLTINDTEEDITSAFEHQHLVYEETYYYVVTAFNSDTPVAASQKASGTPERLPIEGLTFEHDNFETCVTVSTLEGGENEGATFVDELDQLTNYGGGLAEPGGCYSASVGSLGGAEWLTSTIELNASINDIDDVSPLAPLIQLTHLDMSYNSLSDVSDLSGLVNLEVLDLRTGSIEDVGPLAALTKLRELYLSNNSLVTGVAALAALTQADLIDLSDTGSNAPCADLAALIAALGTDVVDPDAPSPGSNCTE